MTLHSENGILGTGPYPTDDNVDPDLINAGKETVTVNRRCRVLRFGAVVRHDPRRPHRHRRPRRHAGLPNRRPRQLDGARQDGQGHGRRDGPGARRGRVIVLMEHTDRDGNPKIVDACTLPLTGQGVVNRIITNLAVIDVVGDGTLDLREVAPGVTVDEVVAATGTPLEPRIRTRLSTSSRHQGQSHDSSTSSVIVAGARTPMGRLLGSLKDCPVPISVASRSVVRWRRPGWPRAGGVRDHGAGPHCRCRSDPGAAGRGGRGDPDGGAGLDHQQGVPVGDRRDRVGGPADPRRRVRRRRRRWAGVDVPGPAPAAELAGGFQVRRHHPRRPPRLRRVVRHLHRSGDGGADRGEERERRTTISREEQDAFAAASHQNAARAWKDGLFDDEVVPVSIPQRKGDPVVVAEDEGIRADTTVRVAGEAAAGVQQDGTVTAGSASQISDGAAARRGDEQGQSRRSWD